MTHEIDAAMETWMYGLMGYTSDDAPGVSDLKISGCQWYRYTSFLDLGIYAMMAPEERILKKKKCIELSLILRTKP